MRRLTHIIDLPNLVRLFIVGLVLLWMSFDAHSASRITATISITNAPTVPTQTLTINGDARKSVECTTAATLATHPGATKQERIRRTVSLQARNRSRVDQHLARAMSVRTPRIPAY